MPTLNVYRDRIPKDAVWIGRPSKWGNPFPITLNRPREEAIAMYRRHLWQAIRDGRITRAELAALHGKPLACCCRPKPCHGDVLKKAAAWAAKASPS